AEVLKEKKVEPITPKKATVIKEKPTPAAKKKEKVVLKKTTKQEVKEDRVLKEKQEPAKTEKPGEKKVAREEKAEEKLMDSFPMDDPGLQGNGSTCLLVQLEVRVGHQGDISNPHLPPSSSSSQTIWRLLQDIPYNEFSGQSRCCYRTASSGLHCNPPAVTWTRPAHRDGSVPTTRASISL
ncbi:hypothetical protein ILYODFUR_029865, partial [Ilyodon furcidens]